jgi:hypothetical protein
LLEIEQAKKEQEATKLALDDALERARVRIAQRYTRAQKVYVFEDVTKQGVPVFKVGSTKTTKCRMASYYSARFLDPTDNLKHQQSCCDEKLLESVVHHMLRRYADINRKDWMHTSFQVVKATIVAAQAFLDGAIGILADEEDVLATLSSVTRILPTQVDPEVVPKIVRQVRQGQVIPLAPHPSIPLFQRRVKCVETVVEADNAEDGNAEDSESDNAEEDNGEAGESTAAKVDRFFTERCMLDPDAKTQIKTISSMYRFWNRGSMTKAERLVFNERIQCFPTTRVFNEETKVNQISVVGMKLNSTPLFVPSDPPSDHDRFVMARCIVAPGARGPSCQFVNEYMEWDGVAHSTSAVGKKREAAALRKYLTNLFHLQTGTFVYKSSRESGGYIGITLASCPDINGTSSSNSCTKRKPVFLV